MSKTTADFERAITSTMSEHAWQAHVIALARACGWLCAHFRPAMTAKGYRTAVMGDGAGFPDLVLCGPDRGWPGDVAFVELKAERGTVSPRQREWLNALASTGSTVAVWVPSMRDGILDWLENDDAPCPGLWTDSRKK